MTIGTTLHIATNKRLPEYDEDLTSKNFPGFVLIVAKS